MDLAPDVALSSDQRDFRERLRHFAGNWVWRATEALIDHPDFEPSAQWLKNRLNISLEEAVEALDGLEKLGVLTRNGAQAKRRGVQFLIPQDLNTRSVKIQNNVHHSQQILNRLAEKEVGVGITYYSLLTKAQVNELYEKFDQILSQMHQAAAKSRDSRLFGISFSASAMDEEMSRGDQ